MAIHMRSKRSRRQNVSEDYEYYYSKKRNRAKAKSSDTNTKTENEDFKSSKSSETIVKSEVEEYSDNSRLKIDDHHLSHLDDESEVNRTTEASKTNVDVFECQSCYVAFESRRKLKIHLFQKHGYETATDDTDFWCNICCRNFHYRRSLIEHIRRTHPTTIDHQNSFEKNVECRTCSRRYSNIRSLKDHITRKHPEEIVFKKKNCECHSCSKKYRNRRGLREHIRKVHPDEISQVNRAKQFLCDVCRKRYLNVRGLQEHIRRKHRFVMIKKKKHFECAVCQRRYEGRYELIDHIRRTHSDTIAPSISTRKSTPAVLVELMKKRLPTPRVCPLCTASFTKKANILRHFNDIHSIAIVPESMIFSDEESFNAWKADFEDATHSRYVVYNKYSSGVQRVRVYVCHRSGSLRSRSRGLRHMKMSGSQKINSFCPAEITLKIHDGVYSVAFVNRHIGHDLDARFLKVGNIKRGQIIAKLVAEVSLPDEDLESLQTDSKISKEDRNSLTDWLTENARDVLYYKPVNEIDEELPLLKAADFVLVTATECQLQLLRNFGQDVICVDGTYGLRCEFKITTVAVLDHLRQGFPCVFLFSNRQDEYVYRILFDRIGKKIGSLRTKVLMGDLNLGRYVEAWKTIMPAPEKHLLCSWQVLQEWKANVKKIEDRDKRNKITWTLNAIRTELNPLRCDELVQQLLTELDPEMEDFGAYIRQHFLADVSTWAYCYRKHAGINTNMIIERFFSVLRKKYRPKGMKLGLAATLDVLWSEVKRLQLDRVVNVTRGKLAPKVKTLRMRHKTSTENVDRMNFVNVLSDDEYYVSTLADEADADLHLVKQVLKNCDCAIRCHLCNACLHMFTCTCVDNCIQFNMCEHIHLVCMHKNEAEES